MFTRSLDRVRRPCRGLKKFFPTGSTTLLRLQLWRTRDCAHRSRHVVFFLFYFLERKLPDQSKLKEQPCSPWPCEPCAISIKTTLDRSRSIFQEVTSFPPRNKKSPSLLFNEPHSCIRVCSVSRCCGFTSQSTFSPGQSKELNFCAWSSGGS